MNPLIKNIKTTCDVANIIIKPLFLMKLNYLLLSLLAISLLAGCKKDKPNKPPVASAGLSRVIQLPENSVILSGSGKDADGSIASYVWSRVSGPNTPVIETPGTPAAKITGMTKGMYVFKLEVTDDDGSTASDTVTVTVFSAFNKVPLANAGPVLTTTLPSNTATLSGGGTDVDGNVVAYLWSQVSGPAASTITNPGSASTVVSGLVEGKYVFQLMVTDNEGATGVDTTSVIVNVNPVSTLVLQPFNNPNERHVLGNSTGINQGDSPSEFSATAWTTGGLAVYIRGLFSFDLSAIPSNATIVSASLSLYSNPNPLNGNLTDANFGTNNSFFIQRITQSWVPSNTTWSNQPSTTTANQISIPHTNQSMFDLIDVDVKNLIQDMRTNGNFGFLIKLQTEQFYNSRNFCSSRSTLASKRPKLVIQYQ